MGHPSNHINIGLVAHVDAGKTTLSEGMLYLSGSIRDMGRVTTAVRFSIHMNWSGSAASRSFPTGGAAVEGSGDYSAGYAGACGFFRGDGAGASGAGLRDPYYQWRRTGYRAIR